MAERTPPTEAARGERVRLNRGFTLEAVASGVPSVRPGEWLCKERELGT